MKVTLHLKDVVFLFQRTLKREIKANLEENESTFFSSTTAGLAAVLV